jgi:hypothetical protein
MKVQRNLNMQPTVDNVTSWLQQIARCLSGNVSFGHDSSNSSSDKNIEGFKDAGTTPATPDTDFSVAHGLGRVPLGYIVLSLDQPVGIYKSPTAWTTTTAYFRCSTASANYVLIVI